MTFTCVLQYIADPYLGILGPCICEKITCVLFVMFSREVKGFPLFRVGISNRFDLCHGFGL